MRMFGAFAAAALLGGAMLLSAAAPASATALPNLAGAAPADATVIDEVDNHRRRYREGRRHRDRDGRRHRDRDRHWSYDRHRHGHRHRYRRPGYHYFYDGYYYASPWWVSPGIGLSVTVPVVPTTSAHVQWCLDNFRTYDIATDTYIGYDGYRHRCNSPFR